MAHPSFSFGWRQIFISVSNVGLEFIQLHPRPWMINIHICVIQGGVQLGEYVP